MTEASFGDALAGTDGTGRGDTGLGDTFTDALAVDPSSSFALPGLPVAPGGDFASAQALVAADPLPDLPAPVAVPGGQWGYVQPAPAREWAPPSRRPPAPQVRAPRPAPRLRVPDASPTLPSGRNGYAIAVSALVLLVIVLVVFLS